MLEFFLDIFFFFQIASSLPETLPAPVCGDAGSKVSATERRETRVRVRAACEAFYVGTDVSREAIDLICESMDAIVVRESSGRAGVRHTGGKDENGLGAMGLSIDWQSGKWPGKDEDPYFCSPEVSVIVAMAIFHRAFRYGVYDMRGVQAIYGGHFECRGEGRNRSCWALYHKDLTNDFCARLKKRGQRCTKQLTEKDLGRKVKFGERRAFADKLRRLWMIKQVPRA